MINAAVAPRFVASVESAWPESSLANALFASASAAKAEQLNALSPGLDIETGLDSRPMQPDKIKAEEITTILSLIGAPGDSKTVTCYYLVSIHASWRRRMRTWVLLLGLIILASCDTSMDTSRITAGRSASNVPSSFVQSMCVRDVRGAEERSIWDVGSPLTNAQVEQALEDSLAANSLLASTSRCRYAIDVSVLGVGFSDAVGDFTVSANFNYSVFRLSNDRAIFLRTVSTDGKATMSDAVIGAKRGVIAQERAVRRNFETFIRDFLRAV